MCDLKVQQNIEKYRELYDYSRDLHFKQIERANRVDQKAAMLLSAVTVLIGFTSFFLKSAMDDVIPPSSMLQWWFLITVLASGILVLGSWFCFLMVLRVKKLENLRLDNSMLEFFHAKRRIDIHYYIAKKAAEAYRENDKRVASKIRKLNAGYFLAIVSIGLLTTSLTLFLCYKWQNPEPKTYERSCKVLIVEKLKKEVLR